MSDSDIRGWPSLVYESRDWVFSDPDYVSKRELARHAGPYQAAVPAKIVNAEPPALSVKTQSIVSDAAAEIARFDEEQSSQILPYAALLLRSEAVASSQIESLTSSAKAISSTEIQINPTNNAKLILQNVSAMQSAADQANNISGETIIEVHKQLLQSHSPNMVGQWRAQQVWIGGGRFAPHRADYIPPHYSNVPDLMQDLVVFANRTNISPLVHIALTHAQFETIHPFPDGNGRTGRALIHSMLISKGLIENVCIPVSAGLLYRANDYYQAFTQYQNGNPEPIVEQIAKASLSGIRNARQLAAVLTGIEAGWKDIVTGRADSAAKRILELILKQPVINSSFVETQLKVSAVTALAGLRKLEDLRILDKANANARNQVWIATEVIDALDDFAKRSQRRE